MAVALRLPFVNIAFPWRVLHVAPLRHVVLHPSIFHTQKHAKSVNRGVFARTYSRAGNEPWQFSDTLPCLPKPFFLARDEKRKLIDTVLPAAYGPSAVGNGLQQEEEDKLFMATALEDARMVNQPCKSHSLPSVWMHETFSTNCMQLMTSATMYGCLIRGAAVKVCARMCRGQQ